MAFSVAIILADSDGMGGLWLILVLVMAGLGKLADYLVKRKQEQDAEKEREKFRLQRQQRQQNQQGQGARPAPPRAQARSPFHAPSAMPRTQPPPPPRQEVRSVGLVDAPAPVRSEDDEEILRVQRRLAQAEQKRQQRQTAQYRASADKRRTAREVEDVAEAAAAVEKANRHRVRVDLSTRSRALGAIIGLEILSPPKALRDQPELWDQ